ncbi:lanthionine synthetase LanC family protein [Flavobacterium sp. ABG]|uniref:lanthionine synthetase LanC family protein n=1 Tax=Flavobacterium sp. ABG TaxID=1423322 RepID=UPI00064A9090|nr:lanthionine synthetase LanC family protein [Flavobacterium sp. ABG]KLT70294.1 hypothetical protein AB674_08810 [Flavobacterium sp. ABG]
MVGKVFNAVNGIIENIEDDKKNSEDLSLFTGIGALPVLKYLKYKCTNDPKIIEEIHVSLNKFINQLNETEVHPNYCSGLAGLAKMFDYILRKEILDKEATEDLKEALLDIDELISEITLSNTKTIDDVDFLHGSFGTAFYLLERLPYNSDPIFKESVVKLFERLANIVNEDITNASKVENEVVVDDLMHKTNCGLAHGHTAYIIIFSKFLEIYPENDLIKEVLKRSVSCLLKFESTDQNTFATFPSIAVNQITAQYDIALGWCYGDQSISLGLYKASVILQDNSLKEKAISLAYRNVNRNSLDRIFPYSSYDSGFCHGLASVAYIHKKWFAITGDDLFYKEYEKYISNILDFGEKHEGFPKFSIEGFKEAVGMLDGTIGVGMVLLDYLLGPQDYGWDNFFLLDVTSNLKNYDI